MTASKAFFYFCLSFLLGILIASFKHFSEILLLIFFVLGTGLSLFFFQDKKFLVMGFCLLFFSLAVWRFQSVEAKLERPDLAGFSGKSVIILGEVIKEPERKQGNVKLEIKVEKLQTKILLTTNLYPEIEYGDKLKIKGVLKEPPELEGFNYKDYLKKQGIYFVMDYPKIEISEKSAGNPIKAVLIGFKTKLKQSLQKIVTPPGSGFFEALLFGEEQNISKEWKEKLNITGARHIAAVSGMNITILSVMLLNFLLFLGFWRQHAFWLSLLLIFLYILMIGSPASGMRAGIMGALFLSSQYFGRISSAERLMSFALTLMLFFNPLLLRYDVGFQLSFLAVAGLIYFAPIFLKLFKNLPNFLGFRINLASTLSAQAFTLPVLLYNFGQFSLIAPITNVLILPAIPLLTVVGFLFSFLGIFCEVLARVASLPGQVLLMIIMKIIDFFAFFPFISTQIQISGFFVLVSYILLAIFVWYLRKKQKLWFLDY